MSATSIAVETSSETFTSFTFAERGRSLVAATTSGSVIVASCDSGKVTSIAAQILLARRVIENWVLWIAVDAGAIPLYLVKGLTFTAVLYLAFLLLCLLGLYEWAMAERKAEGRA